MCKRVVPRQSRCFCGRKVNVFGIFKVQHANREQRKYNVYNYLSFLWHLDCNERSCINNVISHFVAPKLYAITAPFLGQNRSYPDKAKLLWLIWERFLLDWLLGTKQKLLFLFFFLDQRSTVNTDQRPFFVRRATVMIAKTLQFKNQTTSWCVQQLRNIKNLSDMHKTAIACIPKTP